ncbi:hypothetical protein D8674_025549 [Pyrus ussuriensis x Pyrus communis]|uniref:Transmembrane protein n=1 Tax=Pyrus ussuriensis x Pyrus communis TaxID=2448454 RepID=A0A5N5I478_9ROSA|nr:uncharacterized protein LOC103938347 [Pyrus x bretschneideri]KAB2635015.1 hypothetical protein D8674_025549 [Pyrus ussuriensis x Pyrus communis]
MAYYRRSQTSSFLEGFSLSPLPYPVLLILAVISIFLGISWYSSYESAVEEAEGQFNWVLLLTPIFLILIVKGLSSMDPGWLFSMSPWDRRRRTHHIPSEGSSPWGVAAFIILLLVLLQYQSSFRDSWLI